MPLHLANFHGHREIAALLLQNRADIWVEDLRGKNPIHLARINADGSLLVLMLPPEDPASAGGDGPPDADEWFARGHSLAVVGRYDQAIAAWQRAAGSQPDRPEARASRVLALRSRSRLVEAERYYRELMELDPQAAAVLDGARP